MRVGGGDVPSPVRATVLKPDDFPVHTGQNKIVKPDGEDIAEASTPKIAEEVAKRLNAEEDRREEDRWA
jgi:hypothetical protein